MSDSIDRYDIDRLRSIADWLASFPNDDYKDDALFIEDVISKIAAAEKMGEPSGWEVHAKVNYPADEQGQRIIGYRVTLPKGVFSEATDYVYLAPPPAVPEWKDPYTNNGDRRPGTEFRHGWNACRDAMLAAAEEQGHE